MGGFSGSCTPPSPTILIGIVFFIALVNCNVLASFGIICLNEITILYSLSKGISSVILTLTLTYTSFLPKGTK